MSQTVALPRSLELPGGGRLPRLGSGDAGALEARAAELAKRSIKRDSKLFALDLAIRMIDLTTLEGADTPGKVRALSAKAIQPDPADPSIPSCAAGDEYPHLVPTTRAAAPPARGRRLWAKAIQPCPADPSIPSCAAVCVYPNLVPTARAAVAGSGVKGASVATALPSG